MKILCKQMPHERQEHGGLGLLILKSLVSGPKHGYAIVEHLRATSKDVLHVGESALYPAQQRLY
jgi:DNA-binding PadR family transcriptional regulator